MKIKKPKEVLKELVQTQEPFIKSALLSIMEFIDDNLRLKSTGKLSSVLEIFEGESRRKVSALFDECRMISKKSNE